MRLHLPVKVLTQRFALPSLILVSVVMLVLGRADASLFERVRGGFLDFAAPILEFIDRPLSLYDRLAARVHDILSVYEENARLRQENDRLLQWQNVAQRLRAENEQMRALLQAAPDPAISFLSARVVATSGGAFLRSVMIDAGSQDGITRGEAAVTSEGLVGRIAETGLRASRVLLLTDMNARIPVRLESTGDTAVLAGDNSDLPRLLYLPQRTLPKIGERIVTSGHGGVFPPGLPVGLVSSIDKGVARVETFADLTRIQFLRIVNYGLIGVLPEPVPPVQPRAGKGPRGTAPTESQP